MTIDEWDQLFFEATGKGPIADRALAAIVDEAVVMTAEQREMEEGLKAKWAKLPRLRKKAG